MRTIETDYLVVGAGAMGMAFVDTLVTETEATVVVVDRNHQPGGHWNTAYPFVRLHQPSAYYGVNSRPLGSDTIDRAGFNEGFYELATANEICAYLDAVMHQQLLPTGRVSYFPMSEYLGDGRFRTLGGEDVAVTVRRRVVDATYLRIEVPSMRPPPYRVAAGVECIPPNELPRVRDGRGQYVIVGAGKTGMDAILWLLRHGVPAQRVTWVKPREAWLLDRTSIQPGPLFAGQVVADFTAQMTAISEATSIDDLFDRLAAAGCLLRVDESVRPQMYRCAIVSRRELEALRTVTDVVRLGHVQRIEAGRVVLDDGVVDTDPSALFVDCTGEGLGRPIDPEAVVFTEGRITLQPVRTCQPVLSAAIIAHMEAAYHDDETRNAYCRPVPHPDVPIDWMRMLMALNSNQSRWLEDPQMAAWLDASRLNVLSHVRLTESMDADARQQMLGFMSEATNASTRKLAELLAGAVPASR